MAKPKTRKVLKHKNGTEYGITKENGKYYICGKTQFRKSNPDIAEIVRVKLEEETEEKEEKEEEEEA